MKKSSLRKNCRATVNLLVGETRQGRYSLPLLANISEEGIYLQIPSDQRSCSHDAVVEMALPGVPGLIWARCRVLREEDQGFFTGRALQFLDISPLDRQQVRLYVQRCIGIA